MEWVIAGIIIIMIISRAENEKYDAFTISCKHCGSNDVDVIECDRYEASIQCRSCGRKGIHRNY